MCSIDVNKWGNHLMWPCFFTRPTLRRLLNVGGSGCESFPQGRVHALLVNLQSLRSVPVLHADPVHYLSLRHSVSAQPLSQDRERLHSPPRRNVAAVRVNTLSIWQWNQSLPVHLLNNAHAAAKGYAYHPQTIYVLQLSSRIYC